MRHHCGCKITITTDPKNAEYLVTEGARRKIETYDAEDAQVGRSTVLAADSLRTATVTGLC
jgi:hypothetical protein